MGETVDVAKIDSSMTELGYEDQDARFMANAMATKHLHVGQFERDGWSEGTGSVRKDEETTYAFPTANEFRDKFKKNIGKDGRFKGDNNIFFQGKNYHDFGTSEKPNEDFEGDPQGSVEKTDPIDPVDPIGPGVLRQEVTGQIIPPRQEEIIVRKEEEDDEEDEDVVIIKKEEEDTGGGGLPRMDLGFDTVNPSDYTGGEAEMATGPFANQTEMDRRMNAVAREFEAGGRVVKYSKGGSFPDLTKDGKITMADILKGRGVKGEYAYGGKMRSYEEGGKDPNEMVNYKGKMMKRSQMEAMWAQEDAQPQRISEEDLYKKYLKSRDKASYIQQEGASDIIKEQERLFEQRGNKFSDGTGYRDLFEYGGKMKNYASGGKVLRYR
jgi:hypothetical protein